MDDFARNVTISAVFSDVLKFGQEFIGNLLNEFVNQTNDNLDHTKNETVDFLYAFRALSLQLLNLTDVYNKRIYYEAQRQYLAFEKDTKEFQDSLVTLPRFRNFTVNDALYGGATVYAAPGDKIDIIFSIFDLIFLVMFWYISLMIMKKDFIKTFFMLVAGPMSLHTSIKWIYSTVYWACGVNYKNMLIVTFFCFKTTSLFLSFGSIALILLALATNLNRRPPSKLDWKIFMPIFSLCVLISLVTVCGGKIRTWYWTIFAMQILAMIFHAYTATFVLIMWPCKTARVSRFERDVAVVHAKSNLAWILLYQFFVLTPLLSIDFGSAVIVSGLSEVVELLECSFAKVPTLGFPCSRIFFLLDNSMFIRPMTILGSAMLLMPSFRHKILEAYFGKQEPEKSDENIFKYRKKGPNVITDSDSVMSD